MTAERFHVLYRVTPDDSRPIETHAKDICIEQTVEIPESAVPAGHWEQGIIGIVESIAPTPDAGTFDVRISYRVDLTSNRIHGLLNVLFGNTSMRRGVKIADIRFTELQIKAFGGPQFGVAGLRKALNVFGRPLATTAIKPVGLPSKDLAQLAGSFARGGLDIIKDDHGLVDQHFHPFKERVSRVQEAVDKANASTGRACQYHPMVAGGFEELDAQMTHAKQAGCFGVLVAPMLIGADAAFGLAKKHGLAIQSHPSMTGTHFHDPKHGMTPAVLLGQLFRLFGADVSIFPNFGGRFTFSTVECTDLANDLRKPMSTLQSVFPAPAGGMTIRKVGDMISFYGVDTALLIGGDLLKYDPNPEVSARAFVESIEKFMSGKAH